MCEPDAKRVPALQIILKQLEDRGIPHFLFLNKIDASEIPVRELIPVLQPASSKPLVLRQIPIWENGVATGFVDLASERAYVYRAHAPSEIIELPTAISERKDEARFHMLEQLADYDDELMEQLLSDVPAPRDKVFGDLTEEFRKGLICPVLLGSAHNENGILRLLKALRHEAPTVEETARRLKLENAKSAAYVFKTLHTAHGGKLSLARVLTGEFGDGTVVTGAGGADERVAGVFALRGEEPVKRATAKAGETVALGRLEGIKTGETISADKGGVVQVKGPPAPEPVFGIGLGLKDRKDEVKMSAALAKLMEEDPSLQLETNADTHQMLLLGQGEMHLRVATERLQRKYGVAVERQPRLIPYKETIRAGTEVRGRHKKQSGGHGQFGDVVIEIAPLAARLGVLVLGEDHRRRRAAPVHSVGGDRREGLSAARTVGFSRGRRRRDADRRLLSHGRFLRHGLPPGRAHRDERRDAEVPARAAGADHGGRCHRAERCHRTHQRHHLAAARTDPRVRYARGLERLGRGAGADSGLRDGEPDRRSALGDVGGRYLHGEVRPSGGADWAPCRSGACGPQAGGGIARRHSRAFWFYSF